MKELSVVTVVYNEEENILQFLTIFDSILKNTKLDYEIVVLDGASTDNTPKALQWAEATLYNIRVIRNKEYKSYMECMKQVLLSTDSKWVFFSDADMQYDPHEFLNFYRGNKYDIINGVKVRRKDPLFRKLQTYLFHFFTGLVFGKWFKDPNTGFRLMNRDVIDEIVPDIKYLKRSPGTEMLYRAWQKGYRILEIGITHNYRERGRSEISRIDTIRKVLHDQLHGLYHLWRELVFA